MRHRITLAGLDERLWLARDVGGYRLDLDEGSARVALEPLAGPPASFGGTIHSGRYRLTVDGVSQTIVVAVDGDDIYLHLDGAAHHLRFHDPIAATGEDESGTGEAVARAPMPGTVVVVHARAGQQVAAGTALLVIESMKLETTIRARADSVIAAVHVVEGQTFERDAVLVSFAGAT
jgi:acetyl/propionyl-CoA carboxylase alpha subunit